MTMMTVETIDLARVTGGVKGNDGGCIPWPWPRPSEPLGPRVPSGPRDPLGPLGPRNPSGPVLGIGAAER
jgi:hypothetical protein